MKLFMDTEFTGLNKDTTLISIGIISEYGNFFYAEFNDYNQSQVDEWISDNVISNLKYNDKNTFYKAEEGIINKIKIVNVSMKNNKKAIKNELITWLNSLDNYNIEFILDVGFYDFVLFNDIFGSAFDTPSHCNDVYHDINQDIALKLKVSDQKAFSINREQLLTNENSRKYNYICKSIGFNDKHNSLTDALLCKTLYYQLNS